MTAGSAWQQYAAALREVPHARQDAERQQDELASQHAADRRQAYAEVEAAADRRRQLDQRIGELQEHAANTLSEVGVPASGPRSAVTIPALDGIAGTARAVGWLTDQLDAAADDLRASRAAAAAVRTARQLLVVGVCLAVLGAVLSKLAGGSYAAALLTAALVLASVVVLRIVGTGLALGIGGVVLIVMVAAAWLDALRWIAPVALAMIAGARLLRWRDGG